ncbi:UDP-glucose/GDP-mannose dehydrogenase family protein [Arthrobacter sp. JSM 101049]|uniref:UDP-glucose dehydrogenase family protein n=1 Tax=Arthrobacter sp. JSM 101049 TaxID=929097 RepID=UPI00356244DC
MRISVIGCGYLGAVHAAAMAKLGHDVVGIDVDENKVRQLQNSEAPFFEPGLPELLHEAQAAGSLTFSTDISHVEGSQVHFICVGTPQAKGEYAADLSYVEDAFFKLAKYLNPADVVVGKSTVPVGTAGRLAESLRSLAPEAELIWNPEFLREGHAVNDTLQPDRLVYGAVTSDEENEAVARLDEVYADALLRSVPRIVTDYATAELVKVSANSFLATKISFINAMAEVCEVAGADVKVLADAIGLDERIGRKFLNAGVGFGGGCLPKDIRGFMARAGQLGADEALTFLREVDNINMRRRSRLVELAREVLGGSLIGKRITMLGASFKPDSDDVRDSPALSVAAQLQLQGAAVTVTDPFAINNARKRFPELHYLESTQEALEGAELVVLVTEWAEYVNLDPVTVATKTAARIIIDGRNVLDSASWCDAGWKYRGMGRPALDGRNSQMMASL